MNMCANAVIRDFRMNADSLIYTSVLLRSRYVCIQETRIYKMYAHSNGIHFICMRVAIAVWHIHGMRCPAAGICNFLENKKWFVED